jgi:hypothetical protein
VKAGTHAAVAAKTWTVVPLGEKALNPAANIAVNNPINPIFMAVVVATLSTAMPTVGRRHAMVVEIPAVILAMTLSE